jgi:hypothetical protein
MSACSKNTSGNYHLALIKRMGAIEIQCPISTTFYFEINKEIYIPKNLSDSFIDNYLAKSDSIYIQFNKLSETIICKTDYLNKELNLNQIEVSKIKY